MSALPLFCALGANNARRSSTLLLSDTDPDVLRTPAVAKWLEGVALRDLAVNEDHAACIDARGDVYQWGRGYFGEETHSRPQVTLRGKVRPPWSCDGGNP